MSDSDVELVPFSVTKQQEADRKRQSALLKSQNTLKRQRHKEHIQEKIKRDKEIQLNKKPKNLFEDEPEQSSSTQSHLASNRMDESFQRNLQEKLPEKVIKSIRMPQIRQQTTIPLEVKSKKIVKKFTPQITIETLNRETNHSLNQSASLDFIKQHLNKNKRVPLSKIMK